MMHNSTYNTKYIFNATTGERRRIDKDLHLPDGFIYSIGMTESHKRNIQEKRKLFYVNGGTNPHKGKKEYMILSQEKYCTYS